MNYNWLAGHITWQHPIRKEVRASLIVLAANDGGIQQNSKTKVVDHGTALLATMYDVWSTAGLQLQVNQLWNSTSEMWTGT